MLYIPEALCGADLALVGWRGYMSEIQDYLAKAQESLAGAESELAYRRFNSCARGAYYACFQAAIAALLEAGLPPPAPTGLWGHDRVQASWPTD